MTLKQLEAFYWAATSASFAVAAQRLNVSVSALSKRIAELEESLGQSLFDRASQRAVLTEAGSRLLHGAGELLHAASELRLQVAQRAPGLHGTCRFGVGELTALTWLPRLVNRMQQEHHELTPEPYVDIGEVLEHRVEQGELDFAVVAGRSTRSRIASMPIAQARFAWCASPQIAGQERELSPSLLAQWPLVTLPPGAGTTKILEDWLASHEAVPRQRINCNHWGAIAGMLCEGAGIGLLPEGWAHVLQQRGLLQRLTSQPELASLSYSYQWRRDDARPVVKVMKELVKATADFSAGSLF